MVQGSCRRAAASSALGTSLLAVLAGCLVPGDLTAPSPALAQDGWCVEDPIAWAPQGAVHDHLDLAHHAARCRMDLVAHASLVQQEGEFAGAHTVAMRGDLLAVGVRSGNAGHGFDLFDIRDPAKPVPLGSYRNEQARGGDRNLAISDDGRYVFLGSEGDRPDTAGVWVVDVSDPQGPVDVSLAPISPYGVHTLGAFVADGAQYVAAVNFGVHLLRLDMVAGTPTLVPAGRWEAADPVYALNDPGPDDQTVLYSLYGHEATIRTDPLTGRILLYYAHIYSGVYVVDVTEPATPTTLAHWAPEGPGVPYVSHMADAFVAPDGRRIMVVGEETFMGRARDLVSRLWFVDVTDFSAPTLVGTWQNPGGHEAGNIFLSVHYFDLVGHRLYLSHYHGGVWALDVADPSSPRVVGYYMPNQDTGYVPPDGCCLGKDMVGVPMTFDVRATEQGLVVGADFATGLYLLQDVT